MSALVDEQVIGWQVIDADGNIVSSGPVSVAEMTAEMLEQVSEMKDEI